MNEPTLIMNLRIRIRNWWQNFDPASIPAAFFRWLDKTLCNWIDRLTKDHRRFDEGEQANGRD